MKRLTERFSNGQAAILGCGENCKHEYLHCNDGMCPTIWEIFEKLATYEDAEEQRLLIRLPCKVGDEVWEANGFWKKILKRTVAAIVLSSGNHIYIRNGCGDSFEFGVDVFVTKAEAEKALAEMG